MCGILGGNFSKWNYEKALQTIKHRGPDAQRIVRKEDFTLGFARLSVIDLSDNGMQPMFTDDGKIGIVFNGEIYGYQLLRDKLEKCGYCFRSTSDTEVILYAYCEWGDRFIDEIDGMFAIAIYDGNLKEIHLFRDRTGIKPLYYFADGNRFAFSSELKGITSLCDDYSFKIDQTAIYDYLIYQYIPDPKTMYQNVYKLEPATEVIYSLKKQKIELIGQYWEVKINSAKSGKVNEAEAAAHLEDLIQQSVKEQIVADVPVGTFLSGGVDSSVITYEISKLNQGIAAFSMGFEEKTYDETPFAEQLAEYLQIPFYRYEMKKDDFDKIYCDLKTWYDEPFGDSTAYPNYLISKSIRQHVTVALSGDGGDEIFGGYTRYKLFDAIERKNYNSVFLSKVYKKLGWDKYLPISVNRRFYDDVEEYAYVSGFRLCGRLAGKELEVKHILGINADYDPLWHFRKFYHRDLPRISMAQCIDFHSYLPCGMLTKVDRTSMAVSLEVRVPFLDRRIVEYAFSLPEQVRCTSEELKKVLKDAYKEKIPSDILYRKKKGFTTPELYYKKLDREFRERVLRDLWGIKIG